MAGERREHAKNVTGAPCRANGGNTLKTGERREHAKNVTGAPWRANGGGARRTNGRVKHQRFTLTLTLTGVKALKNFTQYLHYYHTYRCC